MSKLKSRKFWMTIAANLFAGYLASKGHPEAAVIVGGIATGSYNIGQGMEDSAKAKAGELVSSAIEDLLNR